MTTTGNVSVRLSVVDAETVRAALEKLGSDGQAALKKIEAAAAHPTASLSAVDKTVANLKQRFEQTAQSLGPLGTLLTGLGPIGLTVAAGIGAAVAIMYEMAKAANELGDRAGQLRNFAEATGLSTGQVQALTSEGAKFSLSSEQISIGLQRLATNLDMARQGTGTLYDDLKRISPQLAHQVASAKDVATAYDLIGRAIAQAHDKITAAGISQAAFGRQGAVQGQLAADVASSGGVGAITSGLQSAGKVLDDGLLKRLATLRSEIVDTEQVTKDLEASLFAEDTLKRILAADQAMERMAIHMKEMKEATSGESWGQWAKRMFAKMGASPESGAPADLADQIDQHTIDEYRKRSAMLTPERLRQLLGTKGQAAASSYVSSEFSALSTPKIGKFEGGTDEALKDLEKRMKALGDAATAPQKLGFAMEKLNLEFQKGDINAAEYAQKLGALEQAEQKASIAAREQLGIASESEILSQKMMELKKAEADGYIQTEAEKRAAIARTQREAEQAYKQEQVRNSAFKGLAEMSDSTAADNLDKLGAGTLNDLSKTLVEIEMNSHKSKDAFREFAMSTIQSIEQMITKIMLIEPLARGMQSLFGLALPGGGVGQPLDITPHAMGGVMTSRGPMPLNRYASGGVARGPQLAMFGEGSGPEAYVPLPDGRAIPVNINGGGGGMRVIAPNFTVHMSIPQGTSVEDAHRMTATAARQMRDIVNQAIDDRLVTHLRTGGLLNA